MAGRKGQKWYSAEWRGLSTLRHRGSPPRRSLIRYHLQPDFCDRRGRFCWCCRLTEQRPGPGRYDGVRSEIRSLKLFWGGDRRERVSIRRVVGVGLWRIVQPKMPPWRAGWEGSDGA